MEEAKTNETMQKLSEVFQTVQRLDIQPTENNVKKLSGIMQGLRNAYASAGILAEKCRKMEAEIAELRSQIPQEAPEAPQEEETGSLFPEPMWEPEK